MLGVAKMFNIRSEADSAAVRGQAGMQLGLGDNSQQLLVEGESGKLIHESFWKIEGEQKESHSEKSFWKGLLL